MYNQDDDLLVDTLLEEDKSRTNNCALFFVKRGFPFISILDGGFFSAHSWLCRNGPALGLSADIVLDEYKPKSSSLARLETAYMEHMDRSSKTSSRVLQRLVNRYVSNAVDIKKKLEENYGGSNDINEGNRFKMTFSNFLNTNSKNTESIRTVDGDFQMDSTTNEECLKSQKTEIDTIKEKNSFKMAISSLSRKGKIIDHKDKERVANQDTFKTKENENNLFKKPFGRLISNKVEGKDEEENEEEKVQKLDVNVDQIIEKEENKDFEKKFKLSFTGFKRGSKDKRDKNQPETIEESANDGAPKISLDDTETSTSSTDIKPQFSKISFSGFRRKNSVQGLKEGLMTKDETKVGSNNLSSLKNRFKRKDLKSKNEDAELQREIEESVKIPTVKNQIRENAKALLQQHDNSCPSPVRKNIFSAIRRKKTIDDCSVGDSQDCTISATDSQSTARLNNDETVLSDNFY